jgi:ATP-dependent RNA helicase HelY
MSLSHNVKRIGFTDLGDAPTIIGRINIPATFDSRSPKTRKWLGEQMRVISAKAPSFEKAEKLETRVDIEISRLRKALRSHPCHGCNDREDHVRWHDRIYNAQREISKLESKVESRTSSIAKEFDRICAVLTNLNYLSEVADGHEVTAAGQILGRMYCELDLLAAQCLRGEIWDKLSPEQLAAVVSTLVYESRRDDDREPENIPDGELGISLTEMVRTWGELKDIENQYRMDQLRELDPGFLWPTLKWSRGQTLAKVLRNSELQPGDFVRWTKQVIDLLGQIALASEDPDMSTRARQASDLIDRGIVAW